MYFNNLSENELKNYININLEIAEFTPNMLKACEGSIGKAKKIYENREIYSEIDKIFNNIENYTLTDVISKLNILYKRKEEIEEILEYLNTIFIDKAKKDIKYIDYIKYVEETKRNIKANCNYDMTIDNLMFKIWSK